MRSGLRLRSRKCQPQVQYSTVHTTQRRHDTIDKLPRSWPDEVFATSSFSMNVVGPPQGQKTGWSFLTNISPKRTAFSAAFYVPASVPLEVAPGSTPGTEVPPTPIQRGKDVCATGSVDAGLLRSRRTKGFLVYVPGIRKRPDDEVSKNVRWRYIMVPCPS